MMILVRYIDGTYDMVMAHHLDSLIASNRLIGFERSNKWITIGVEPIRGAGGSYDGPDRRRNTSEEAVEQENSP
jgi:hypothetical protein